MKLLEWIKVWLEERKQRAESYVLLKFADDTKDASVVECVQQREEMQATINKLVEWSADWQMLFNTGPPWPGECQV